MEIELQILEEDPKVEIHFDSLKSTLKKYQTIKSLFQMSYTDFGFKNSPLSATNWLPK